MVYVDQLRDVTDIRRGRDGKWKFPCKRSCHMTADSLDELHAFAVKIGMKPEWSQKDHFDLGPAKRSAAVRAGAVEIGQHEMSWRVSKHGLRRKSSSRRTWCFEDQEPLCELQHRQAADRGERACRECGGPVEPPKQSWCSEQCVDAYRKRVRPVREQVFERDKGVCAICGDDHSEDGEWDADHIIPLIEGGPHTLDNVRTACRAKCHKAVTAELRKRMSGKG